MHTPNTLTTQHTTHNTHITHTHTTPHTTQHTKHNRHNTHTQHTHNTDKFSPLWVFNITIFHSLIRNTDMFLVGWPLLFQDRHRTTQGVR